MTTLRRLSGTFMPCILALAAWLLNSCCQVPPEGFMSDPAVQRKMAGLQRDLIAMLPENEQKLGEAQEEARWLTYTAFNESAKLARENKPIFVGWINNNFVNMKYLPRGLCWHYQHDMFRELRRRPLKYFYLGATVRDQGKGREHSCVYLCQKDKRLKDAIVLDAWANCGNLKLIYPKDRKSNWQESPYWQTLLNHWFPPGHKLGRTAHIELVKKDDESYHELVL